MSVFRSAQDLMYSVAEEQVSLRYSRAFVSDLIIVFTEALPQGAETYPVITHTQRSGDECKCENCQYCFCKADIDLSRVCQKRDVGFHLILCLYMHISEFTAKSSHAMPITRTLFFRVNSN